MPWKPATMTILFFLNSDLSKIILGILWGFGLAVIFRHACLGNNCVIYKSPVPATIKNNIYSF